MSTRRNILFIQTDAHFHNWLGFRGAPGLRTPHLDALACEQGVVFNQAFTCSGVCVPSRMSTMTARYPIGHGVMNNQIAPHAAYEPMLGQLLAQAGYTTGYFGKTHFANNDHDMAGEGWNQSFTKYDYIKYLRSQGIDAKYPEGKAIDIQPIRFWTVGRSRIPAEHYFEPALTSAAVDFLTQHAHLQFACYVSMIAPHGPFSPPGKYADMYNPDDMQLFTRHAHELDGKPPQSRRWIEQNQRYFNNEELRIWLASVYGLVTMVDDCVGRLIHTLRHLDLLDSTLIVFTSDHGDFATRHGIIGKSWCMSDDLLRIPLIIAHPQANLPVDASATVPRQSEALVQTIDVTATLLDWAGVPLSRHMHGQSLLPLLNGQTDKHRDHVFACDQSEHSGDRLSMSMVRSHQWKYIESTGFDGELYDMNRDPLEMNNLVHTPEHATTRDALRRQLLQWHVNHSGGYFNVNNASFWEDETRFYDDTLFCGERINPKNPPKPGQVMPSQ